MTDSAPGKTLRWTDRDHPSVYANNAHLRTTPWDFKLVFGQLNQEASDAEDEIPVDPMVTVYMSPQHAKALTQLLSTHVESYESRFGRIPEIPEPDEEEADEAEEPEEAEEEL